jgi:hypothetical protein
MFSSSSRYLTSTYVNWLITIYITKKMAACTFYQNALQASGVNDWIKMTQNHPMMRNFSTRKKLSSCFMPVLKSSIHFFKPSPTAMHSGKMYICDLFHYHGQLNLIFLKTNKHDICHVDMVHVFRARGS